MKKSLIIYLVSILLAASSVLAADDNWPRFRGPNGLGQTEASSLPTKWSGTENIAWKTPIEGAGASSPVVWGDKIFVTGYTGYDRFQKSEDFAELKQHVYCFNASDGALLWDTVVDPDRPQRRGGMGGTRWHGYATSTPVVDAEAVYVYFGNTGVYAYDHDGEEIWQSDPGAGLDAWGSGSSPVLCGDLLIVNAAPESGKMLAYNKNNGEKVWEQGDIGRTWSTPVIADSGDRKEIVLNVKSGVAAYNPENGERLWFCEGAKDYAPGSPIAVDGIVYSTIHNTHGGVVTQAIKTGGSGNVKETHEIWRDDKHASYVSSAVLVGDNLYWPNYGARVIANVRGLYCADAKTGEIKYHVKPDAIDIQSTIYAAPLTDGKNIYFSTLENGIFVVVAQPEFELISANKIETDDSRFTAAPVPLGDSQILLRSDKFLYCIGKK